MNKSTKNEPTQTDAVASVMSLRVLRRRWIWSELSVMSGPMRLKPVAMSASGSAGQSSSPAICSRTKRS